MMIENNGILFLVILIFLMGLYFVTTYDKNNLNEGFENSPRCPDMLIQKGAKFFLYNSKLAKVPGVNPIEFSSLEEYVEFTEWQRSQDIRCPILYAQSTYDTQGKEVFKIRPDPLEPEGGLPSTIPYIPSTDDASRQQMLVDASRDDEPYNSGSFPGFDPDNQYIGENTPLDKLYYANDQVVFKSISAMSTDWNGVEYSREMIDKIKPQDDKSKGFDPHYIYEENEIKPMKE
jgi:hypothetical protein